MAQVRKMVGRCRFDEWEGWEMRERREGGVIDVTELQEWDGK